MKIGKVHDHIMRILSIEGKGKDASQVMMTAPMIISPGEKFKVKIALTDSSGLMASSCDKTLAVSGIHTQKSSFELLPSGNFQPVFSLEDISLEKEGFHRFEARLGDDVFYSNPVYCKKDAEQKIFWGDPHIHTVLSDCHAELGRSMNFCFSAARYLSCLDWCSASDHVSNGRCELARWREQVAVAELFNDPGEFATVPAYEESFKGGMGGDNNIYFNKFPSMFEDEYENGSTKTLSEKLSHKAREEGFEFFMVPHHTSRTVKHGEINREIYPGKNYMPLVEIHSKWGSSEYRGNPYPLKQVHSGPSFVQDFLNDGIRFGFIGGTDSHATLTFARDIEPGHIDHPPGLTAVYASELSRENIFESMKNGNCYAAAGERIFLDVGICGEKRNTASLIYDASRPLSIDIKAAAPSRIESIDIVRNGQTLKQYTPDLWNAVVRFTESENLENCFMTSSCLSGFIYYYVRVKSSTGGMAWSSPVWIMRK